MTDLYHMAWEQKHNTGRQTDQWPNYKRRHHSGHHLHDRYRFTGQHGLIDDAGAAQKKHVTGKCPVAGGSSYTNSTCPCHDSIFIRAPANPLTRVKSSTVFPTCCTIYVSSYRLSCNDGIKANQQGKVMDRSNMCLVFFFHLKCIMIGSHANHSAQPSTGK